MFVYELHLPDFQSETTTPELMAAINPPSISNMNCTLIPDLGECLIYVIYPLLFVISLGRRRKVPPNCFK